MNGFERISRTLAGHKTDQVPVMLHNFMQAALEAGMTMQEFRSRPENMARVFIDASLKYELDGILTDVDTALEAYAIGAKTDFPENVPAKVIAPAADTLEECIALVDPEKLLSDERVQIYLEAIRLIRRETGGQLFLRGNADQGPFSLAAAVYGLTNMMLDMTNPNKTDRILELIERCYEVHLTFHRMVKAAGADMTSFGDSMGSPDLISPRMYRQFVAPFHARLVRALSLDGISTVCHICGKTDAILQDWSEHRFTGVEIDFKTDIAQASKIMKGKSTVFGIIDPSGVFCRGDRDAVIRCTRETLNLFPDGGLVIGAGCALPAETPPENIFAFVQSVHEMQ